MLPSALSVVLTGRQVLMWTHIDMRRMNEYLSTCHKRGNELT